MSRLATSPGVASLAERQMRNWEIARRMRVDAPTAERPETGDFICLSRPYGVDAGAVAERLGKALGWPVFDKQILDHMAGDDRTRRLIYAAMDQRDLAWWEQMLQPLIQGRFQRNDYFPKLCETLLGLARRGDAVFVGRGADLVLPSSRGVRVRLTASVASRLDRLTGSRHMTKGEARRELERVDQERRAFLLHHFSVESDDPLRHDMVLNLDRLSLDQAVELILAVHRMRTATAGG